jgi:hypothetical protein
MAVSAAVAALLALGLAGCGGAISARTGAVTPQATATAAPTVAAAPTATPLPPVALPASCHNMNAGPYTQIGDLIVSAVDSHFVNVAEQLPQGTPNRPLKISTNGQLPNINPGATPIAANGQGLTVFSVCNGSASQTASLQSVSVRIASFTPYSGALAGWNPCKDGYYDANQQAAGGGCGGGYLANEYLRATFPSGAGVGDTTTGQMISSAPAQPGDPNPYPALPLSIAPGHVVSLAVTAAVPNNAPGAYTLAFGLAIGSAAPAYFATTSPSLYAPIVQEWSGQNCTAASMKSQIPVSAPQGTLYICPPAS